MKINSAKPVCLLFWMLTVAAIGFAQSHEQTIRKLRQESNDGIKKHDTAVIARYWLDDVHVLTSRSVSTSGKRANQLAFQRDFASKENLLYVRTPSVIEVFSNWNMAAEHGSWVGTWTLNGNSVRISGSYYAKWHSVDGAWKIKSEIYTPTKCEGGDYCKAISFQSAEQGIVVQNFYFPKAGKEKEVLETRQRASKVREQMGLPAGRILLRVSESTSQPYIVWECEYPSLKAREDDVNALDGSDDFKKVQEHMGTLLDKFDRALWQVVK